MSLGADFLCRRCRRASFRRGIASEDVNEVIYICGPLCPACVVELEQWWQDGNCYRHLIAEGSER